MPLDFELEFDELELGKNRDLFLRPIMFIVMATISQKKLIRFSGDDI